MIRHLLVLACAALVFASSGASAWPDAAEEAKQDERLVAEATALYAKIFESEKPPAERCGLNNQWFYESIPEHVAREHLGMKLHADLVARRRSSNTAEVLDPSGNMRAAFCSDGELLAYHEQATSELRAKLIAENAQPDGLHAKLHHTRIDYSFPVFNETFDRAIIVQKWTGTSWTWGSAYVTEGDNKHLIVSVSGAIHAYVWAKKNGVWQQIDSEEMAQFD